MEDVRKAMRKGYEAMKGDERFQVAGEKDYSQFMDELEEDIKRFEEMDVKVGGKRKEGRKLWRKEKEEDLNKSQSRLESMMNKSKNMQLE